MDFNNYFVVLQHLLLVKTRVVSYTFAGRFAAYTVVFGAVHAPRCRVVDARVALSPALGVVTGCRAAVTPESTGDDL